MGKSTISMWSASVIFTKAPAWKPWKRLSGAARNRRGEPLWSTRLPLLLVWTWCRLYIDYILYMYIHIYIYIYMSIYIWYICICTIYEKNCTCVHNYTHTCRSNMYLCIYVWIHECMNVWIIHTYMYANIHTWNGRDLSCGWLTLDVLAHILQNREFQWDLGMRIVNYSYIIYLLKLDHRQILTDWTWSIDVHYKWTSPVSKSKHYLTNILGDISKPPEKGICNVLHW